MSKPKTITLYGWSDRAASDTTRVIERADTEVDLMTAVAWPQENAFALFGIPGYWFITRRDAVLALDRVLVAIADERSGGGDPDMDPAPDCFTEEDRRIARADDKEHEAEDMRLCDIAGF